jgi:DNA-binding response OmpR family regulator
MNQPTSRANILVVDDDPKITSLLRIILERAGYRVREENKSYAAVGVAREFQPQLAILDVDMPGKDGGAVAADLATEPKTSGVQVIFLSSLVTEREAGMRGSYRYLSKPVDAHLLVSAVRHRLAAAAMAAA